jgi:ATP-dependent DNA ligase
MPFVKPQKAQNAATVEAAVAKCRRAIMEPKYDGWRALLCREAGGTRVFSRTGKDYTAQVPEIVAEVDRLPVGTILDGELVAMRDDNGRLINDCLLMTTVMGTKVDGPKRVRQMDARKNVTFIAFDCLQTGGEDSENIEHLPLESRLVTLRTMLGTLDRNLVTTTLQIEATEANHQALVDSGMEGSVVKDLDAPYAVGKRGHGWYKIKATETVDCVIMELPVDGQGQFRGQVGRMVIGQMRDGELVERTRVNAPDNAQRLEMTLAPERYLGRVVEVKVYGWYEDGAPRHPTFGRWREDKAPIECTWHEPAITL